MRNCDYYQELISRSLDDELSVEERKALAVHLASCPSCSQMRQLMADISGLMEEDMEELPDGLHEDIMASVRRSEMIKRNGRTGRNGKNNGRKSIKISRPVRNILATAACMALVIAAAVSLNPGERAESVVMARSAANSTQTQTVTESAAPESTQTPAPTASPTPSPVSTESPNVQTATLPQTGTTAVNEGTIITTPVPTVDPNADWRNPISSGSEDSSDQNRVIINQATPSPSPVVVSTPAPTPTTTPSPVATPTPSPSPYSQPEQAQQDAAAEEEQGSASQFQAAENGQTQQPETGSQSEISGEVHKKAPDRVFSLFPSLMELTPAETVPPQDDGNADDKADAVQSTGELPQVSPTPCPDAEEYDMMDDKEGSRELLLQLMGMEDENGAAPEEAQLPEGQCDRSYVIAMVFDDIPCEVVVKVYGEELYFSLAEIIIDPLETAEDPASVEPSQPVEQPAPEENTMEAEAYDVAGAETQIQVQAQDSSEDFEPIWFRASCSLADFTAKLDSLTK